jgi:hypothetical protein
MSFLEVPKNLLFMTYNFMKKNILHALKRWVNMFDNSAIKVFT